MAVLLKTTPRKREKRGSWKARARYAQKKKEKGKSIVGVRSPPPPEPTKRFTNVKDRSTDARTYRQWPVPEVSRPPPVNERPNRRVTGVRDPASGNLGTTKKPQGGKSLAPGLEGGVDPGLFRKPEHFAPKQTPEEEEEDVIDEIMEQMRASRKPSPFAGMFGEESERNE